MIFPSIHLNGTSAKSLLEDQMKAMSAIRQAIDALCNAAPNGRDYYPQGPDAFQTARNEHRKRIEKLEGVLRELEQIAEYIAERET